MIIAEPGVGIVKLTQEEFFGEVQEKGKTPKYRNRQILSSPSNLALFICGACLNSQDCVGCYSVFTIDSEIFKCSFAGRVVNRHFVVRKKYLEIFFEFKNMCKYKWRKCGV